MARLAWLLMLSRACFAQYPAGVTPDISNLKYPPLARQARIMGTVNLTVDQLTGDAAVVSGHPLLALAAKNNIARWQFVPPFEKTLRVEYEFGFSGDPQVVKRRVPRGDAFDHFFQRLFHLRTYEEYDECVPDPSSTISMSAVAADVIRVIIQARNVCLNVNVDD